MQCYFAPWILPVDKRSADTQSLEKDMHEVDLAVISRDTGGGGTSKFKTLSMNGHLGWPLLLPSIQQFNSLGTQLK